MIAAVLAALHLGAGCGASLSSAIARGDVAAVEAGLASSSYRSSPGFAGQACIRNQPEVLKLLVERGAALEANSMIASALTHCIIHDRPEMTRYLLSKGVAISSRDMLMAAKRPQIQAILVAEVARRANPGAAVAAAPAAAAAPAPAPREPYSDIDAPRGRAAERPDDFALVIGIEDYQSVPKADFGARDAKTVRRHLEAMGFPARNIISLEGSQATSSKLRSYLEEWLPLNVKPSSTLFVYYSGHGAPDAKTGDAYLVPWDGDPKFLKSTALPLKTFYASLLRTKARRVVVALDACFSGAGGRSVLAQGARPLVARTAEILPSEGRLTVLAAASGDEITGTLQDQGHGVFTYHLLKGLSADPKASAQSLFGYLKPRVQDDARRDNREQTPVLSGSSLDEPLLFP